MFFLLLAVAFAQSNINCQSAYCSQCDASNPSVCTACITDYILQNGKCVYCREAVPNCRYANNGKCTECFYGYFASNGVCKEMEEGCEEYSNGQCKECHDGYRLNNGVCQKCTVLGCEECKRDANTCTECMDGYVLENNKCIQPIANCEEYDDDRSINGKYVCEECLFGYKLQNNECVKIEGNCMKTDANGVCIKCFGPYKPVNGKCEMTDKAVDVIENCVEYDEDGEYECEKCAEGYYPDGSETKCLKCDASCKTCDDRATECETCAEGYYVNQQDKCVKCEKQFAECSTYTTEETCYQCNHKCNWNNRKCVESHCVEYESGEDDPKCLKCETGYVLTSNQMICEASNDGCKRKQGEKCIECHQGYFITEDFKCEKCNENCRTCVHKADNCHSCTKETRVSASSCLECIDPNCLECPMGANICLKCNGNYTVGGDGLCVSGCYKEDCEGKCTMCSDEHNNMDIYYPPTEEGRCLKYSQMPNTPSALNTGYSFMVLLVVALFMMI